MAAVRIHTERVSAGDMDDVTVTTMGCPDPLRLRVPHDAEIRSIYDERNDGGRSLTVVDDGTDDVLAFVTW